MMMMLYDNDDDDDDNDDDNDDEMEVIMMIMKVLFIMVKILFIIVKILWWQSFASGVIALTHRELNSEFGEYNLHNVFVPLPIGLFDLSLLIIN